MQLPRAIKTLTRPLLRPISVRIRRGPNRGLRWSLATAGRGYARGRFELFRMAVLDALIEPGDVVWDAGAHKGYVTLLASRRVGEHGRVFAFEPARQNLDLLRRHLAWNAIGNVEVIAGALGSTNGRSFFGGTASSLTGRVGAGRETVDIFRGDTLIQQGRCAPPTLLKVDVEGYELHVLQGVLGVVPPHARVVVATHSSSMAQACSELLTSHAFRVFEATGLEKERNRGGPFVTDPDLLGIGPSRSFTKDDLHTLRVLGF